MQSDERRRAAEARAEEAAARVTAEVAAARQAIEEHIQVLRIIERHLRRTV